ncbi:MAG: pyridoxal phosphate-dependent aminotransferase [Lachnospiraceae bacterium]|nr:pyridoxal phosphate-dependent aminotransferase [Lachnospiraceae bacterium]
MSKVISEEMERLLATGSTLRAMFEEGKKMRKEFGAENVYDFSLGNPSVPAPAEFNEAMKEVIDTTDSMMLHGYMSNAGYEISREAIANDLNKRFGTSFRMENVTMTVGAANALVVAMKILINPGDEVIVFAPFFLEYRNYISDFGGVTVVVPPNPPTFMPDMEQFAAAITEKTRAVIIDNPNNPTGVVYDEKTICAIAKVMDEAEKKYGHPIFLLSDEPYREIVYDQVEVPFLTKYYKNTLVCYSYSKSMSLPGERIGYLLIPDEAEESERIIAASSIGVRVLGCVNAPSLQQLAIIKVLDMRTDISVYEKNRKALMDAMDAAGFEYAKPEGTFYMFVKTPVEDDTEFVTKAKEDFHVLCSSGAAFDCPGYVRFAYCVDYDMILRATPHIKALGHAYGLN